MEVYCKKEVDEVLKELSSSKNGLSEEEAKKRLGIYGKNTIEEKRNRFLEVLTSQFQSPIVYILFAAAVIAFLIEEVQTSIIIIAILILTTSLSFIQEYRSVMAVEKLKRHLKFYSKVLRDGSIREVDSELLVPGDIVYLETGDRIPADLRIIDGEILVDEAVLTGEHYPVRKNSRKIEKKEKLTLQEMKNIAFCGSMVSEGKCYGIVFATGEKTYFGKMALLLEKIRDESRFQVELKNLADNLVKIILITVGIVFILNVFLGHGFFTSLLFGIALAVGLIPEPLPFVVTLSLSRGSLKLAEKGVIVKRLSATEDLGNVDLICCDKTGTITEGKIFVKDYFDMAKNREKRIILYAGICNSAIPSKDWKKISGNPIDVAILEEIRKEKLVNKLLNFKKIKEIPFDYNKKMMSTIFEDGKNRFLVAKGAPEAILKICSKVVFNGKIVKINEKIKEIEEKYKEISERGLRCIFVAYKGVKKNFERVEREMDEGKIKDLILLGMIVFEDPPKRGAKETISLARKFNINIKIITGDNPIVTKTVLKEVGIDARDEEILVGDEIDEVINKKDKKKIEQTIIFARTTPEQKYKIIEILRESHTVAYLGDGVNDAAALISADVGISVENGADVAKEASDIILTRKSLHSIVDGIIYGRSIFSNIVKYLKCTFAGNFGNLFTVAIASAFLKFVPLLPTQILLVNFITDTPLLAISTDRVDEEELIKPKKWNVQNLINVGIALGAISTFFDLILIAIIINSEEPLFQSLFFTEIVFSEIIVILSLRTNRPFINSRPSNTLMIAIILVAIIGTSILLIPSFTSIFKFQTLKIEQFLLPLIIALLYCIATEFAKGKLIEKAEEIKIIKVKKIVAEIEKVQK